MILNIRGTSGSGKTTLVRNLMRDFPPEDIVRGAGGDKSDRILAYRLPHDLYILGSYENVCGGCDNFSWKGGTGDFTEGLVRRFATEGHVIFEGLIISNSWGRWERLCQEDVNNYIWGFMGTSLEECIQRVYNRRAEKGREGVFKEHNLTRVWEGCQKDLAKVEEAGYKYGTFWPDDGYQRLRDNILGVFVHDSYSTGATRVVGATRSSSK